MLLVDTPGIFAPQPQAGPRHGQRRLDRRGGGRRHACCWWTPRPARASRCATSPTRLAQRGGRTWLVLNKVDLVPRLRLLPLIATLNDLATFEETFMVSATTGDGADELLDRWPRPCRPARYLYPPDDLTDLPDRLLAAEIVREQIFLQTHEEVPYATTVETESFTERPDGSVRIDATIYVTRAGPQGDPDRRAAARACARSAPRPASISASCWSARCTCSST